MIPKVDALNPQVWNGTGAVWLWPNSIVWWHQSKRCQVSICYHVTSIYIHMIYDFFIVRTSYMIYWYILHVTLLKWYTAMLVSHQIYVRLMLCKCTCLKAMSIHGRLTSELQVKLVQGWFYIDVGVGHLDWLFVAYACGNIEHIRKDIVSAWSRELPFADCLTATRELCKIKNPRATAKAFSLFRSGCRWIWKDIVLCLLNPKWLKGLSKLCQR